jgi:hypothetical protein
MEPGHALQTSRGPADAPYAAARSSSEVRITGMAMG